MTSDAGTSATENIMRFLANKGRSYFFWNYTNSNATDFDSNLVPAEDVSVDAVMSSIFFNAIVFVSLMGSYECLRRLLPAVYSSTERLYHTRLNRESGGTLTEEEEEEEEPPVVDTLPPRYPAPERNSNELNSSLTSLPDGNLPFDWVGPVFGVPWSKVRKSAGLDGYFFLRYIRMNVRITAVSTFWFFLVLVPIYATGSNPNHSAHGWYHISAANVHAYGWRMWIACVFAYLFAAFIFFVVKQEYRHFLELRQNFLARGTAHIDPQHHYSLVVENIPYELRSDRALKDYFENLFPGKVHSASVVLNLPDLEEASARCVRSCRRLEKSIAYLHATGDRPTHVVGRGRMSVLGVDMAPYDCKPCSSEEAVLVDDDPSAEKPKRGTRVDSISYYTQELAAHSRILFKMQQRKKQIAASGNSSIKADNWLDNAVREVSAVANRIMDDSVLDNDLLSPSDSYEISGRAIPQAEFMTSRYGSISPATLNEQPFSAAVDSSNIADKKASLMQEDHLRDGSERYPYQTPFARDQYQTKLRLWAGRLGLDFFVAIFGFMNRQLDVALEGVLGATMSSTGYVSFLCLSTCACAASAMLSAKSTVLDVAVAPEPREIRWQNAHVSKKKKNERERIANFFLFLGVILWSFPLAAVQAFAKAEFLARIPGMEWIMTFHGGKLTSFINGYLPVVALLGLIMILPVIFEYVGFNYERRKTFSDVQMSMASRYFYYQVANVYVSVTAGSILKSLADIIDRPSHILELLGESLPTMVGYFVALLVTKIMAGLPMIFLRFGALSRMLLLRCLSRERKLTQRELDAIYRLENVQYGWEFPTQLLVVLIVFTYAVICPVILPFGFLYFLGALTVYKKQVLYVYSPVYESGGAMFPLAVQRTLFGLVCGQMTLLGYTLIRGCKYQPIFLIPLPILTLCVMNSFQKTYVDPSNRLSLERAREYDRLSAMQAAEEVEGLVDESDGGVELRRRKFDKNSYRQPVLTEVPAEPWTYRRGIDDPETLTVRDRLNRINRHMSEMSSRQLDLS